METASPTLHQVFEKDDKVGSSKIDENASVKRWRILTEESIGLEPLSSEIVAYFAERMISRDTLRRNGVMQKTLSEEVHIAFPFRRNGVLVNCKYRELHHRRFQQEKDTEKILYGVDDIRDTDDIIIVEGEFDKLAMEEAGFTNCVSVPNGAPSTVSKTVPSEEKDKTFQYLWSCKEYLFKASRIILATDADRPGQALAEELSRRLGRERCWRVKWPKKRGNEVCKDANEVLMNLGPQALQELINQAELIDQRLCCNRRRRTTNCNNKQLITEQVEAEEDLLEEKERCLNNKHSRKRFCKIT